MRIIVPRAVHMLRSRGLHHNLQRIKQRTDTPGLVYPSQKKGGSRRERKEKKEDKKNKASKNS
jgi:hypothetical protein